MYDNWCRDDTIRNASTSGIRATAMTAPAVPNMAIVITAVLELSFFTVT
jgi:hypothetical protein